MGRTVMVSCNHCEEPGEQFFIGTGMDEKYQTLEGMINLLRKSQQRLISQYVMENKIIASGCKHTLFHCEKCNHLNERLSVVVVNDRKETGELNFRCSKCRNKLHKIIGSDEIKDIPCEHCGQKTLETSFGCWD